MTENKIYQHLYEKLEEVTHDVDPCNLATRVDCLEYDYRTEVLSFARWASVFTGLFSYLLFIFLCSHIHMPQELEIILLSTLPSLVLMLVSNLYFNKDKVVCYLFKDMKEKFVRIQTEKKKINNFFDDQAVMKKIHEICTSTISQLYHEIQKQKTNNNVSQGSVDLYQELMNYYNAFKKSIEQKDYEKAAVDLDEIMSLAGYEEVDDLDSLEDEYKSFSLENGLEEKELGNTAIKGLL